MPTENCRLFLALWPDASVRAQLARHVATWSWPPGCSRYAPADWHLTLHFLGAVPRSELGPLAERLCVPFAPFQIELHAPQLWPHGLAVLGAGTVPPALMALQARLGQALQAMSRPTETRPYRPHVSLARHAGQAEPPLASAPVVWRVRDYVLVESTGQANARYRVLQRYPAPQA